MPAPVPIQFAAELGPLAELAVAAGAARARRQQQANDRAFLHGEFERRQRGNEAEAQFRLQQSRDFAAQDQRATESFQLQRAARQLRGQSAAPTAPRSSLARALAAATGTDPNREPTVSLQSTPRFASLETKKGTFTLQPDGSVQRESPRFGEELVDPNTGQFNPSKLPDEFRDPGSLIRDRALAGGSSFVAAGRGGRDEVPLSVAQQIQVVDQAAGLPPEERAVLQQAVRAGGLTTNQLLDAIKERTPKATDERKVDGLSLRDRELEIQRLRRRRLSFNDSNDFGGTQRQAVDRAIAEEREMIVRQKAIPHAPQLSGRSLADPHPNGGTVITAEQGMQFLQQAGGDPALAERLARDAGFVIPQ